VAKIMISNEKYVWSKGKISVLPLKLVENQASARDRMSALAQWRCGHGTLATRR
jgi:hypothetical protein